MILSTIQHKYSLKSTEYSTESKMGQVLNLAGNPETIHSSFILSPNVDVLAEAAAACPQKRKHHPSLYGNLPGCQDR